MAKRPTYEELEQKVGRLEEAVKHKRMEEELKVSVTREQEQASKSEAIIAGIGDPLTIIDTDFKILYENKIHQGIFGKHIGEYCYMAYQNRDQVCGGCPSAESLKNGKIHTRERTVQSEKGTQHFEITASPFLSSTGKIAGVIEVVRDTTKRRQVEEALRESEERYRRIVNTAQEGIWVVDADAKVTYVSQRLADMLGYTVEEILGSYLFGFMDDLSPAGVGQDIEGSIGDMKGEHDFRFSRKDGSKLWGMVSSTPIFDDDGKFDGGLGMIIDVTKRKRAEHQLKESREQLRDLATHLQAAREQERTIIAREIHDDLGQNLSVLKIDLTSLEKRLPKDEEALIDKTKSIAKFVDMIVQSVKRIYSGLRPFLLDDLGLIPAMEWMARGFQDRTGIKCELFISPEDIVIDKDLDTTIFRIFQEALTNAGSHANATSVKVSLGEKGMDLILIVSDNGKGITEKQVSDSKSFGLMGMRERALSVGGEVNIRGIQNEGTTVKVKIPRKK